MTAAFRSFLVQALLSLALALCAWHVLLFRGEFDEFSSHQLLSFAQCSSALLMCDILVRLQFASHVMFLGDSQCLAVKREKILCVLTLPEKKQTYSPQTLAVCRWSSPPPSLTTPLLQRHMGRTLSVISGQSKLQLWRTSLGTPLLESELSSAGRSVRYPWQLGRLCRRYLGLRTCDIHCSG